MRLVPVMDEALLREKGIFLNLQHSEHGTIAGNSRLLRR